LIRHISSPDHIVHLSQTTLGDSIAEILERLLPGVEPKIKHTLRESMLQRERLRPTVVPHGAAFPRAECRHAKKIMCGVGISEKGIAAEGTVDTPIQALFVSLYPEGYFSKFVPVLESLVRFSQDPQKMALLCQKPRREEAFEVIRNEVSPRGPKDWIHEHLILPVAHLRNHMEALVRVRHD
jgi:mannitol/fructose-specific phosphotransferase system IIA component (Ntr-type)